MIPLEPRAFILRPGGSAENGMDAERKGVALHQSSCWGCHQLTEFSAQTLSPEDLTLPSIPELSPRSSDGSLTGFLIFGNVLNFPIPQLVSGRRFNYIVMSLNPAEPAS